MNDLVEALFLQSGKTINDLLKIADEISALPHDTSDPKLMKRGTAILDLVNNLENSAIGPGPMEQTEQSRERRLIAEEREILASKAMQWSINGKFSKNELVDWLKIYFAIQYYAEKLQLGTEFIRNATKGRKNTTEGGNGSNPN